MLTFEQLLNHGSYYVDFFLVHVKEHFSHFNHLIVSPSSSSHNHTLKYSSATSGTTCAAYGQCKSFKSNP